MFSTTIEKAHAARMATETSLRYLDLSNPRQYLMQDLFDSDSDSDSASSSEEDMTPAQATASTKAYTEEQARIGDVASHIGQPNNYEEDDELEAYEKAARKTSASNERTKLESESEAKPTALQSDRSIQDSLSGELLRMAGILKANSLAFADALERDRKILEEAGEKLQGNLTLMTRTRGKLGEYSKKARGMGWLTLGSVAVVCMSWVVMFVLIRLT